MQDLVTARQVGEILGVSRQRADELARSYDDFPAPVATVGRRYRLWDRAQVELWGKEHSDRKPGRRARSK